MKIKVATTRKSYRQCIMCGKEKTVSEMLTDRNDGLLFNVGYCSQCIKEKMERDGSPVDALRMLNIPYVESIWFKIEKQVKAMETNAAFKKKRHVMSEYLKHLGKQRTYKTFHDSSYNLNESSSHFVITDEIIARWGKRNSQKEYEELEANYNELLRIRPPKTQLENSQYIENCLLKFRMRKEIDSGSPTDVKNILTTYSQNLKDIGLDQESINRIDENKTLGQRIAEWEQVEPVPEIDPDFADVDKITYYFERAFLIPMKRVLGIASSEELEELERLSLFGGLKSNDNKMDESYGKPGEPRDSYRKFYDDSDDESYRGENDGEKENTWHPETKPIDKNDDAYINDYININADEDDEEGDQEVGIRQGNSASDIDWDNIVIESAIREEEAMGNMGLDDDSMDEMESAEEVADKLMNKESQLSKTPKASKTPTPKRQRRKGRGGQT